MFKVELLPRNLAACQRDFGHPDENVRLSVVRDLGRGKGDHDRGQRLELLTRALADLSSNVRKQSLLVLADLEAREVMQTVLSLLCDVEIRVRQMAVMCLGEIAEPSDDEVVGRLATLLRAGDPAIRYQALIAHTRIRPEEAAEDLARALRDDDAEVRELAVRLVDEVVLERGISMSDALVGLLRECTEDSEPRVRLVAQLLAGELGHAAPRDMLLEVVAGRFRAREPRDEQTAIELAGKLGLKEAVPALERRAYGRFGFSFDSFRWVALSSLSRLGDARAIEKLHRALSSRSAPDRALAEHYLNAMKDSSATGRTDVPA